jgi:hypothetical protein
LRWSEQPPPINASTNSRKRLDTGFQLVDARFYLTPILRPIFRWNHNWSAARAKEGLEPFARSRSGGGRT